MSAAELLMLCPSRSRPEKAAELRQEWDQVTESADLLIAVDDDDPEVGAYDPGVRVLSGPRGLGPIMNALALEAAPHYAAVGFLGDDHRPRTPGWDRLLMTALGDVAGIAYGNDLFQGERVPTAVVISSPVIIALGYMVPPGVEHLYMDDFWYLLGETLGHRVYCPDVVIEHCHPVAGKAAWDASYVRSNSAEQYSRDSRAFSLFLAQQWPADLERLKEALDGLTGRRLQTLRARVSA